MSYTLKPLRYLGWFVGLSIGLPLVILLIDRTTGVNLNSAGVALIPAMLTALKEGQIFARTENRPPERAERRYISIRMFILAVAVTALQAGALIALNTALFVSMLRSAGVTVAVLFVVALLCLYGLTAVFFRLGARTELKAMAKRAAKPKDARP